LHNKNRSESKNIRKKRFFHNNAFKKDMTYILGARCIDGVLLVGDTKVTTGRLCTHIH
jgi:20S proteasome alpha/beta subunit